jgi:hypothetical protein
MQVQATPIESKHILTLEEYDKIIVMSTNPFRVFQGYIPIIDPPMTPIQFSTRALLYATRFEHRCELLWAYLNLETTRDVDFISYLAMLEQLGFTDPKRWSDHICAMASKLKPPTWDDLLLVFKYDKIYGLSSFQSMIRFMKGKPTHTYILKLLEDFEINHQYALWFDLIKYGLFPKITTVKDYHGYVQVFNKKLGTDVAKYKNPAFSEESSRYHLGYWVLILKLLPDVLAIEPEAKEKVVDYHIEREGLPPIDITLSFEDQESRSVEIGQDRVTFICYPDGRAVQKI